MTHEWVDLSNMMIQTLLTGIRMRLSVKDTSKWVVFRYEKMIDFCHICGLFDHTLRACSLFNDAMCKADLPYGNWLRASPTRKQRTIDHKKEEECKLVQDFKGSLSGSGESFTWWNKQAVPNDVYERLD
ncbi:RNA-directed RNA polymerase L [Bienertia sinuspersici]